MPLTCTTPSHCKIHPHRWHYDYVVTAGNVLASFFLGTPFCRSVDILFCIGGFRACAGPSPLSLTGDVLRPPNHLGEVTSSVGRYVNPRGDEAHSPGNEHQFWRTRRTESGDARDGGELVQQKGRTRCKIEIHEQRTGICN